MPRSVEPGSTGAVRRIALILALPLLVAACADARKRTEHGVERGDGDQRRMSHDAVEPWEEADRHVERAVLVLLRDRASLLTAERTAWRDKTDAWIRTLMMDVCRGPLVSGRIDIATTPIEEYFDLSAVNDAQYVRCEGLVVSSVQRPGRAFDKAPAAPQQP